MKRILAMVICVALLATMAITGSVAYLQDEARDVNTMTMGEVKITQNELKRNGSGYEKFENDEPLYPAVYVGTAPSNSPDDEVIPDADAAKTGNDGFWSNVVGAQDKIVSVTNTGKSDAYVRTWFAFEADANGKLDYIHINWKTQPDNANGTLVQIDEDGEQNKYVVFCVTYPNALEPGKTTENSLLEVHMDPKATNEYVAHFGDTYKILVVSQAVQAANMGENATVALNRAFPAPHPWTTGIYDADLVIYDAEDLFELADTINHTTTQEHYIGKTIVLANDIDLAGVEWTPIGVGGDSPYYFGGIFDGQGHTIYNLYVNQSAGNHAAGLFGALRGAVKNLTIDGAVINNVTTAAMNGTAVVAGSMTYGTDYKNECKIENVTVKNAKVNGNRYVAGICGMANVGSIVNCSVYNSELTATADCLTNNNWDNGDKVGGILGLSGEMYSVYNNTISGCTVNNVTIKGYRNLGGIVGHGVDANLSGNTTTNLTFYQDMTHDYKKDAVTGKFMDEVNGAKENGSITSVSVPIAPTTIEIYNAAQLKAFADDVNGGNNYTGKTVKLMTDIDLKGISWTPIGKGYYEGSNWIANYFNGTFDGQNHTISNLTVNNSNTSASNASGLFGFNERAIIKNVKIKNANITGHQYCGVVAGYLSHWENATIENCHVIGATVTSIHVNSSDACGDKAGAIVGHTLTTVKDCSATDCTIKAARDAGQIAGAAYAAKVTNCTATNVTVSRETTAACDHSNAGVNIHNDRLYGREP